MAPAPSATHQPVMSTGRMAEAKHVELPFRSRKTAARFAAGKLAAEGAQDTAAASHQCSGPLPDGSAARSLSVEVSSSPLGKLACTNTAGR
jgi:hypothetical protein